MINLWEVLLDFFPGVSGGIVRVLVRRRTFAVNELKTYFGKALIVIQSTRKAGRMRVNVKMEGVDEPYFLELSGK
ncbi:MAG: hypothetical protein LBV74_18785 [Tannerella sp.]|nr:hypothetical protein [Tannerella sp.]